MKRQHKATRGRRQYGVDYYILWHDRLYHVGAKAYPTCFDAHDELSCMSFLEIVVFDYCQFLCMYNISCMRAWSMATVKRHNTMPSFN